jgi:hypothetical protein
MAANTTPIFIATPKHPTVRISTANTARDGTGTLGTLFTAGSNGAFFRGFRWQAEVTTTAGTLRLFIQEVGAGNNEMLYETAVTALTASGTVPANSGEWYPTGGITISATSIVKVATNNAEAFSCWLEGGGDY